MHRALSRTVHFYPKSKEEINPKADSSKKYISFIGFGVLATIPRMSRLVSDMPSLSPRYACTTPSDSRLSKKLGVLNEYVKIVDSKGIEILAPRRFSIRTTKTNTDNYDNYA
jgi:hypothetical protein